MFRVGQKVVCFDASKLFIIKPLTENAVYTVREVYEEMFGDGILLEEISNGMHPEGEYGYRASRFRPIVERKTDISFAQEILRKATKRVGGKAHV